MGACEQPRASETQLVSKIQLLETFDHNLRPGIERVPNVKTSLAP